MILKARPPDRDQQGVAGHLIRRDSADSFIDQNPEMLDANIVMTHYSADVLYSVATLQDGRRTDTLAILPLWRVPQAAVLPNDVSLLPIQLNSRILVLPVRSIS